MPHVIIKHFPVSIEEHQEAELVADLTNAITNAFGCDDSVLSIALEPIDAKDWNHEVYVPEIVNRRGLLRKVPQY